MFCVYGANIELDMKGRISFLMVACSVRMCSQNTWFIVKTAKEKIDLYQLSAVKWYQEHKKKILVSCTWIQNYLFEFIQQTNILRWISRRFLPTTIYSIRYKWHVSQYWTQQWKMSLEKHKSNTLTRKWEPTKIMSIKQKSTCRGW